MNTKGCGLGLTICKKISESMGGTIGVTSEYGKGTIFKMIGYVGVESSNGTERRDTSSDGNQSLQSFNINMNTNNLDRINI